MEEWLKKAWFFQQEIHRKLNDRQWDELEECEISDKINFCFSTCYGENFEQNASHFNRYNTTLKKVCAYYDNNETKFFTSTFVNWRTKSDGQEGIDCVFWLSIGESEKEVCIDTSGRFYGDWQDFILNNELPKCQIIYPKSGKYWDFQSKVYGEIICEESMSCSSWNKAKSHIDFGARAVSAISIIALTMNPLTGPIGICVTGAAVVGGTINTGFALNRLLDIRKHEGLDLSGKTLFAIADVVVSSVGTVAVGVTGASKVLTSSGRVFSNNAAALKLASYSSTVYTTVTGVSSVFLLLDVVYKYKTDTLKSSNVKTLRLMLSFMYNISVSTCVAMKFITYISSCKSLSDVINNLMYSVKKVFKFSKCVRNFVLVSDFSNLLDFLLPCKVIPLVKRITDITFLKTAFNIFDIVNVNSSNDPISMLYNMVKQMPFILKEIDKYLCSSTPELAVHCDTSVLKKLEQWTSLNGIDYKDESSTFDCKINLPANLMTLVHETLTMLNSENEIEHLTEKEHILVNAILTMMFQHKMKCYNYAINKAVFHCDKFVKIYHNFRDLIYFNYFRFTVDNGFTKSLNEFSVEYMEIKGNIFNVIFFESLDILQKCCVRLNQEYNCRFESQITESSDVDKLIFKWQVPKGTTLDKMFYYETALKYLPDFSNKITKEKTQCEIHFNNIAIITSFNDTFKLFFYSVEDNEKLNGLLIYVNA